MRLRAFKQVDVFTDQLLRGNPVAVVLDGEGLETAQMQAFANWTNLSETTFVSPATDAGADYAIRIFTPRSELPFAGHPTLGTAHAILESGMANAPLGKLVQQCAVGLVEITVSSRSLSFRLPRCSLSEAPQGLAEALRCDVKGVPQIVDVGPRWAIAELESANLVAALDPDMATLAKYDESYGSTGLTVFGARGNGDIEVRTFTPSHGIAEDPVCGSGNGAVAAYRLANHQIGDGSAYVAYQGANVGRDGRVHVRIEGADVHIGGACVTCIDGTVEL